jgi:hypothetical protein
MRRDQRFHFSPRNYSFNALQKLFPLGLPAVLLEAALGRQRDLSHRALYPLTTPFGSGANSESVSDKVVAGANCKWA